MTNLVQWLESGGASLDRFSISSNPGSTVDDFHAHYDGSGGQRPQWSRLLFWRKAKPIEVARIPEKLIISSSR